MLEKKREIGIQEHTGKKKRKKKIRKRKKSS
jgi:hypothetical protein